MVNACVIAEKNAPDAPIFIRETASSACSADSAGNSADIISSDKKYSETAIISPAKK